MPPPGVLAYVRRSAETARRTASICTGAFVLAEAGLLDGRRATTHWHYAHDLRTRFPSVTVDEDRIFIADGPIWTSAGMTAGIDLALALVEKDLGAEVARSVARKLLSITGVPADSRSTQRCSNSSRSPIAFNPR